MSEWAWKLLNLAVGVCLFGVALIVPFRRQQAKPDVAWDIVAVLATIVFAIAADYVLGAGLQWTLAFPRVGRWIETLARWPVWVLVVGNLIVEDLVAYWAHRMLHTSLLWHTHAWHHASKYLYWAAGLRGSPIHVLALVAPSYVIYLLFPSPETGMASAILTVASILTQHLTHSNIRIPFAKQLERVFVTPRFHFVHHSADLARGNSNFGFTFTWWDRLFGTYTDPDTVPRDDRLGLDYEATKWRLLLGLPARRPVANGSPVG